MDKVQDQLAWLAEVERTPEYAAEHAKMDFAVALERRMARLGVSRSELARRLGTSAAAVTATLRGDANLTIDRMVRLAHALDARVHFHIAPTASSVHWAESFDGGRKEQLAHAATWAKSQKEGMHGQHIPFAA